MLLRYVLIFLAFALAVVGGYYGRRVLIGVALGFAPVLLIEIARAGEWYPYLNTLFAFCLMLSITGGITGWAVQKERYHLAAVAGWAGSVTGGLLFMRAINSDDQFFGAALLLSILVVGAVAITTLRRDP